MTLTGALVGGTVGVSCHMLNNAVRKIPLSRYPWCHVGLFIGGAYIGSKYDEFSKNQVEQINEMRADRGLPQITGTDAYYAIKTELVPKEPKPSKYEIGPHMVEDNKLGNFFKWMNNEVKVANKMKNDNEVGELQDYDEEEMKEKKVTFVQYFFKRISEREDYDDDIREYCRKMSGMTNFDNPPEGTTMEDIQSIRKRLIERRMAKFNASITDEQREAAKNWDGKVTFEIDPSKFPADMQEEMNRTGAHIKIKEYLDGKLAAFEKMSYDEQKEHLKSLFKNVMKWNSMSTEEKLHYSMPNFEDLPYEQQKKLRKDMKGIEKYSLPMADGGDREVGNSETFTMLEELALEKKSKDELKAKQQQVA